jgi:hypothetical protein
MNKWLKIGSIAGAVVIGVATLGVVAFNLMPAPVRAQQVKAGAMQQMIGTAAVPFQPQGQLGPMGQEGFHGWFGSPINLDALLADALGITVAELQTAREEAHIAAIQQAVDEGLITQAQADQLLLGGGFGFRGKPGFFGGHEAFGGRGAFGGVIDHEALLADALGITAEEFRTANQQARTAAIQQAVDEDLITQAQADLMLGHIQLSNYIDQDALLAGALDITVEELQTARDEGNTLVALVNELGLDAATVRVALNTAYQEAVQQAVTDGVITQDQADQILSSARPGLRGFYGRGGFGGFDSFDGPDGFPGRGGFRGPRGAGGFGRR